MSDRVVVMTPRPGKVAGIVDIPLPRPREIGVMQQPAFTGLSFDIRNILGREQ
jgi:NitT/TauT family transport system ATP-binding protein